MHPYRLLARWRMAPPLIPYSFALSIVLAPAGQDVFFFPRGPPKKKNSKTCPGPSPKFFLTFPLVIDNLSHERRCILWLFIPLVL